MISMLFAARLFSSWFRGIKSRPYSLKAKADSIINNKTTRTVLGPERLEEHIFINLIYNLDFFKGATARDEAFATGLPGLSPVF
jgi:hypothetical protein